MGQNLAFLVGAARSGTTLLQKVLALHPEVACTTNYHRHLPDWLSGVLLRFIRRSLKLKKAMWFKKGGKAYFIDRPWLSKIFPMPVEEEGIYTACGMDMPLTLTKDCQLPAEVLTCLRRRFDGMGRFTGAKVFIDKRTANSRRIPWLREAFPDARYLHLIRDGREVAHSLVTVSWWPEHVVWWAGATPTELEARGMHMLDTSARDWVEEVRAVQDGLVQVDKDKVQEIRYESLLEQPVDEIRNVLSFLQLDLPHKLERVIRSLRLQPRPPVWRHKWNWDEAKRVEAEQYELLKELHYL